MADDYLTALAHFVAETPSEAIPEDVRRRAALVVADCVACIIGGLGAGEVERLVASLASQAGSGAATVPGSSVRLDLASAAYVGGVAGTWHDLDEGNLHTRTHAAIQIVPALLAEAEARGASGSAVIDAFTLAYETVGRLWRAATIRLAVHPHGTTGPLAAAIAIARLRGDGAAAIRSLMNIAMTLGVASSRQALADGATVRNVYTGHSGRAAFEALMLRDAGFSGEQDAPASILGGIYGEAFDAAVAMDGLGTHWFLRQSYFKRFASGRYVHGALDALEMLADALGKDLSRDKIARIDVAAYFMAATMGQQRIDTPFGLRFSIPAEIAARIVLGPRPLADDGAVAFADRRVADLAARVFVVEDPAMTAAYPGRQQTKVEIEFLDGRRVSRSVERILGEGDAPLPDGALRAKFIELAEPRLGGGRADAAFAALAGLDSVADIRRALDQTAPRPNREGKQNP